MYYTIDKDQTTNIFTIEFERTNYELIKSIIKSKLIPGSYTDEHFQILKFKAHNVKSLRDHCQELYEKYGRQILSINDIAIIIKCLATQLNILIELNKTILGYNINDIIVVNNEKYIFIGGDSLLEINEDSKMALVSYPFSLKDFFISPEIKQKREIPFTIHYKCAYYSMASLCIYLLVGDELFNTENDVRDILNNHHIKDSKLYWLLSRCLDEDPNKRCIVLL
jgi:hypothetical protein